MGLLDICDSTDNTNLWFVAVVIGVCGLNLLLTLCVMMMVMSRKGGGGKAAQDGGVEAGGNAPQPMITTSAAPVDAGKASSYKEELLSVQRALTAMERKIDNKRINEVTSSYLLHNAHDAIGNGVPTASQVTLDQIAAHQAHAKQTTQDIYTKLQAMEGMISKLMKER